MDGPGARTDDDGPWFPLTIRRVVQETPRDRSFVFPLSAEHREAFRFRPGQYVTLLDPRASRPTARDYSISSSPADTEAFEVTVRDVGRVGDHVYGCAAGTSVHVRPPRGDFLLDVSCGSRLVLLAGGSGAAPYRSFVRFLREQGHRDPVTLLSSARRPAELLFDGEFREHALACGWFRYEPTVSDARGTDWLGRRGRIDATLLRELLGRPDDAVVYACGPTSFVDASVAMAGEAGVPSERVRRERWG